MSTHQSMASFEAPHHLIVSLVSQMMRIAGRSLRPRANRLHRSFLAGLGSVLEIFPPPSRIEIAQTDSAAIEEDWSAVATDLWTAIGMCSPESMELGAPTQPAEGETSHAPGQ